MSKAVNVRELAEMLSLGQSTIWKHCKTGKLPKPFYVGRVARWWVDDVLKAFKGKG